MCELCENEQKEFKDYLKQEKVDKVVNWLDHHGYLEFRCLPDKAAQTWSNGTNVPSFEQIFYEMMDALTK